jgi:hypothetical protein
VGAAPLCLHFQAASLGLKTKAIAQFKHQRHHSDPVAETVNTADSCKSTVAMVNEGCVDLPPSSLWWHLYNNRSPLLCGVTGQHG